MVDVAGQCLEVVAPATIIGHVRPAIGTAPVFRPGAPQLCEPGSVGQSCTAAGYPAIPAAGADQGGAGRA